MFLDWGNSEEKPITQIFDANNQRDSVLNIHRLAVPCQLNGIGSIEVGALNHALIQAFNEKVTDETEFTCVIVERKDDLFVVDLLLGEESVAHQLLNVIEGKEEQPSVEKEVVRIQYITVHTVCT